LRDAVPVRQAALRTSGLPAAIGVGDIGLELGIAVIAAKNDLFHEIDSTPR